MTIALIVHGGSGKFKNEFLQAHADGCRAALLLGWQVLQQGGTAIDAVETAVRSLEDDPAFDAGRGAVLNSDGHVELDAGLMDGATLAAGAVAAVQRVANPITLARHILRSENVLLVGPGATRYAEEVGLPLCEERDLVTPRELERWRQLSDSAEARAELLRGRSLSTVGAVACDSRGNVVAGTSTGGSLFKRPGRVGDVPLVGSGFYAANGQGGASCTGVGEAIMRVNLAKYAVDLMNAGQTAAAAANAAIELLGERVSGLGGIILIDGYGRVGHAHNTEHLACAYLTGDLAEPYVQV